MVDTARRREWLRRTLRRLKLPITGWVSLLILVVLVLAAILAPFISPYDPLEQSLADRLSPPLTRTADGLFFPLGTDRLGRDFLSRMFYGARISLSLAFAVVVGGTLVGVAVGLVSGFFGKTVDQALMTIVDIQLSIPSILLAIALLAVLGSSIPTLLVVLIISRWIAHARAVRGQVMSLKEKEYIEAARAVGASNARIVLRHLLPNTMSIVLVLATLQFADVIVLEASLSFLGLGVQPPTPSWGGELQQGRAFMQTAWWLSTFPGIALMLVTLSMNRLGDWLRDVLDPALRGSL
ncbi:MAG: ABC transporter permease [Chloroflexi bacterium]|nr:ABC transporter permease [Chloroflexota bacterium]